MSWSRDVYSSMISAVGWDDGLNAMVIEFKNGTAWAYDTDETYADQLSKAASVGGQFHSEVKNQMAGRRIR